jgi:hypothetical protein
MYMWGVCVCVCVYIHTHIHTGTCESDWAGILFDLPGNER